MTLASVLARVRVCVFKIFSEITGPTEAKFHVDPMILVNLVTIYYCLPPFAGTLRRDFTTFWPL